MKLGKKKKIPDLPTGFFLPTRLTGNDFLLKGGLRIFSEVYGSLTLDVDGVLTHAVTLGELLLDEHLTRLKLLTDVVKVDHPVPPLKHRQVRCFKNRGKTETYSYLRLIWTRRDGPSPLMLP